MKTGPVILLSASALAVVIAILIFASILAGPWLIVRAATRLQKEPSVALPKALYAETDAALTSDRPVVLTIDIDGEVYFGSSKVNDNSSYGLRRLFEGTSPAPQKIYIKSSATVGYGTIRKVLKNIHESGYDRIGFVVQKTDSPSDSAVIDSMLFDLAILAPPTPLPAPPARPGRSPAPPRGNRNAQPPPPPPQQRPQGQASTFPDGPVVPMNLLVVEMKAEGAGADMVVAVNTREMALKNLRAFLSEILIRREDKSVSLKAGDDKSYGDVIAVMDELKGAGVDPLLLPVGEVAAPGKITDEAPHPPTVPGVKLEGPPHGIPGGEPDEPPMVRKSSRQLRADTIYRVEPVTPPLAKAAKVSGRVVVEVIVDEEGRVISARALSGHPLLKGAAEKAASGWRFAPALLKGIPCKVIGALTFNFK